MGIRGEKKLEAIPAPVFAQVVGLAQGNHEAIHDFLTGWFLISLKTRDEWNGLAENDPIE